MKRKTKLDKEQEKQRAKHRRETARAVGQLIRNPEGLARLRAISDEEWDKAAEGGA